MASGVHRYLKEKPFGRQVVTDDLSVVLAVAIFVGVAFLTSVVTIREVFGPFTGFQSRCRNFFDMYFIYPNTHISNA
jgi:hypothetical protein